MPTPAVPDPAACPFEIERPVMVQRWERLTFLHWSFEPDAVQRLLPAGLYVESWEGRVWVGLVPFFMRVGVRRIGRVPWATRFCETNVRTYVRDAHGRSGIWFFSLDAARFGAVIAARTTYRLPYFWADMTLSTRGAETTYESRRRWPRPVGIASRVRVEIGDAYAASALTAFDHFLTARWLLFSVSGARRRFARAWHAPWPLHRARLLDVDDHLVAAAGLPRPTGEPLVHYSPGVDVRIGRPER